MTQLKTKGISMLRFCTYARICNARYSPKRLIPPEKEIMQSWGDVVSRHKAYIKRHAITEGVPGHARGKCKVVRQERKEREEGGGPHSSESLDSGDSANEPSLTCCCFRELGQSWPRHSLAPQRHSTAPEDFFCFLSKPGL